MATKLTGTKRQSYTLSDKLRIINFVEQHGNRAVKREFGVSESNVRLWRRTKENLEKMPQLKRANRGKKAAWPDRNFIKNVINHLAGEKLPYSYRDPL